MRLVQLLGVAVLSGLVLTSCVSVAHVEKDQTVDFNKYHTYAWVESKQEKDDSIKTRVSDLTERRIRDAVNAEMLRTGWKEVKNRPDVLISYDVLVERSVKEDRNPVYTQPTTRYIYNPYSRRWVSVYYPSQFVGYDENQRSVREGTLTLSLIDAKSDRTVWQGWTTGEVNSSNLTTKEIQNSVKSIFRKFDVASNK
jgi:hypothetical protein